jgi:hypothetical protein
MKTELRHLSRAIRLAILLAALQCPAFAYNFEGFGSLLPHWPVGVPIPYRLNQNISAALPNVEDGSDPRGAIAAAFADWVSETSVTFAQGADTSTADGSSDGINLLTFENTPVNTSVVGGALAVTVFSFNGSGEITEADIVFSPSFTFTTMGTTDDIYRILPLTLHELGHWLGLEHSALLSSTMFPYLPGNNYGGGFETVQGRLEQDDRTGINQLYDAAAYDSPYGGIQGTVTLGANKVYGGHVVAVNTANGLAFGGNLTLGANQGSAYGTYKIMGLPPGNYRVYVEPMDGPTTYQNWTGNYGAGGYWGQAFTTGFQTTYYGGNASPSTVAVAAGSLGTVNIAAVSGTPSFNPVYAGYGTFTGGGGWSFDGVSSFPVTIDPGVKRAVVIFGQGMNLVAGAGIACSDPTIAVDISQFDIFDMGSGNWAMIFEVDVPAGAVGGPRNLQFAVGGEVAVFSGGLYVNGPEYELEPPPNRATGVWTLMD